jgi:glutathione S-transferase
MYKVLGRQTSGNVQKVLFMLEEIGAEYQRLDFGRQFENTQTADYKALNPTTKVPTFIDGEVVIWESNTILRYIATTAAPTLSGATAAETSDVERWMDFILAAVNPGYLAAFKGAKIAPEQRDPEYDRQILDLVSQLTIFNQHLAGKNFLALSKLTIADIACAPILKRCVTFKLDRPAMPELERWVSEISARPAFKRAVMAAA